MISLQNNKIARFSTLCALYFAQGFPWGFIESRFIIYERHFSCRGGTGTRATSPARTTTHSRPQPPTGLAGQRFGLAATGRALLGSSWLARSNSHTWASTPPGPRRTQPSPSPRCSHGPLPPPRRHPTAHPSRLLRPLALLRLLRPLGGCSARPLRPGTTTLPLRPPRR